MLPYYLPFCFVRNIMFYRNISQVLYQLYEAKEEKKEAGRKVLGQITIDKINEFCKKEKNEKKQQEFAAEQLAIYQSAIASL